MDDNIRTGEAHGNKKYMNMSKQLEIMVKN